MTAMDVSVSTAEKQARAARAKRRALAQTEIDRKKKSALKQNSTRSKAGHSRGEKFAALTPNLLARDASSGVTRPGAKIYSTPSMADAARQRASTRIAVTFRMEPNEFVRLRKGADLLGAPPRDVVKKAIKNCLDAYGVDP